MPEQRPCDRLAFTATVAAVVAHPVYLLLVAAIHAECRPIAQPHLHMARFSALMLLGVALTTAFVAAGRARWVLLWAVPAIAFLVPVIYISVSGFFENGID